MVEGGGVLCRQFITDQARMLSMNMSGARRDLQKDTLEETFELFHTEDILHIVTRETNREADHVSREWNDSNPDKNKEWKPLDPTELKAYTGLLILAGGYHGNHEELWNPCSRCPFFLEIMSPQRFRATSQHWDSTTKAHEKNRESIRQWLHFTKYGECCESFILLGQA